MVYRALVALVGACGISLSSLVLTSTKMMTLVPLPFPYVATASDAVTLFADAGDMTQECTESGTCIADDDNDGAAVLTNVDAGTTDTTEQPTMDGKFSQLYAPNGDRLITVPELATHTMKENRIWLSILGRVYDVTDGEDFYGALRGGYKFYAGRDASPCFSTGNNTPEGAEEKLEEWDTKKQLGVYEWSVFYADHKKYEYMGVLAGSRYFDEGGTETELRRGIVERCSAAKAIQDEERDKKKAERLAARMARKEKLANKNKVW